MPRPWFPAAVLLHHVNAGANVCTDTGTNVIPYTTHRYIACHLAPPLFHARVRLPQVFARVSPGQKAAIVDVYNGQGLTTLMCGDGTNDVAALKRAHVGVALLFSSDPAPRRRVLDKPALPANGQAAPAPQLRARGARPAGPAGKRQQKAMPAGSGAAPTRKESKEKQPGSDPWAEAVAADVPKLGDASMAAPFTAKSASVGSVCQIVRQGRATLATTLQMLQILALNCLINSYTQSVLYTDGIRFSDTQMTVPGLCIAMCMFQVSRTQAATKLSAERPRPTSINPYLLLSVLGQFAVHIACLHHITTAVHAVEPLLPFDPGECHVRNGSCLPVGFSACGLSACALAGV